ncbi:MAG TPA: hypothetical protein PK251_00570 [Candidatus Latescibacteria bacterium]|nr:hypothetical protein [Candidatus Latescibacterota bacterium]HOF59948.1 hypothetical protein [Candidatus Latescibacterota bacterium]HOS63231.1 hypothetical protein [Candidatus Latescibacterota bacterium]HPK75895.1 hypothetical protein [Candidatus Latescibacterota bacterium]
MKTAAILVAGVLALAAQTATASGPFVTNTGERGPTIAGAPTADLVSLMRRQGLFDSSKLTTWRSYSFGIASSGGTTTSAGLLLQHIQYQIATPLTLRMDVGLLHNPLGVAGFRNGPQQASIVIPALDLVYRPTENMVLSVHYSQMPSNRYGYGYGYNAWWNDPSTGW